MRDGFGSPAIMPGTAIVMHGTQAFGRSRPVRTRCGCLITGSIATADMCWWKDTGGKKSKNGVRRGRPSRPPFSLLREGCFVERDLVAAEALRAIERQVGVTQKKIASFAIGWEESHTDGE